LTKRKTKWTEAEKKAARALLGIEEKEEGNTVILDNASFNTNGYVTGAQLEEGAKYIVSVYFDSEENQIIDNVEVTTQETCMPPDSDNYISLIVTGISYAYGEVDVYIQQIEDNKLRIGLVDWSEEGMPHKVFQYGKITLIKVNE
jgi:hypothetical protein